MSLKPKLAICLPSRGVVFSKTMEAVTREIRMVDNSFLTKLFMTHDKPLPECFNDLTVRAMAWGAEYLWFVEEDMILPDGILVDLLKCDELIVTADYPVIGGHHTAIEYPLVTLTGTGCLLVDREVFEKFDLPYWKSQAYNLSNWQALPTRMSYGGHDAHFSKLVSDLGYKIKIVERTCGQYRMDTPGQAGENEGTHLIQELLF